MMIKLVKSAARKLGVEVTAYKEDPLQKSASLSPAQHSKGNVLLSYVLDPFLLHPGQPISNAHTHDWESLQIARTFVNLGFKVDIIDYRNYAFVPEKIYTVFMGARTNFETIARKINPDCIKIVHLDTAHWLFNNLAAYQRISALLKRKGVAVKNPKFIETNSAIEWADCATILGNRFTINTYRYAKKPIHRIPISTCHTYPKPTEKDWALCNKRFMWFGSGGLVHKGLDLVLEAFAKMPEYHLYVCGPIEQEKDFQDAYQKELYETPNIHTVGWVDVSGPQFIDLLQQCIAVVYPSCSEGGGGSVVNCLHGGLIPIVSYESSVDVGDFGMILPDNSVDAIRKAVVHVAELPVDEQKEWSQKAWAYARENHTRKKFKEECHQTIIKILASFSDKSHGGLAQ